MDEVYIEYSDEQKQINQMRKFSNESEKMNSNRRRIREKFSYLFSNDSQYEIKEKIIIKNEPTFQIVHKEDQFTKDFYQNQFNKNHSSSTLPRKSILKKCENVEGKRSRSSSSSSPSRKKKKLISSNDLDQNDVPYLAQITSKITNNSSSVSDHSLFDQTINIFNEKKTRPTKLEFYIKPYRGDHPYPSTNNQKQPKTFSSKQYSIQPKNNPIKETLRYPSPPLSDDSYYTPDPIDDYLTIKSTSSSVNRLDDYDQLLKRMVKTDEELQSLSNQWIHPREKSVPIHRNNHLKSSERLNENLLFSPLIIQLSLFILIIFNLIIIYFFNEINIWWTNNISSDLIQEQQQYQHLLNF